MPAVTVVVPVKVFVPESASVPVSSFVRFADPETTPEIVPVTPDATWIVEFADKPTVPDTVPPAVNRSAPFVADPVPEMLSGSGVETAPTDNVPPASTVVGPDVAPRESAFDTAMIPAEIVVEPEYVFAAERVRVLDVDVDFNNAPAPETIPEKV